MRSNVQRPSSGGAASVGGAARPLRPAQNSSMDVEFAELSDVGRVRQGNEDYLGHVAPATPDDVRARGWLFALADGVGGHDLGEVASHAAVESMLAGFRDAPAGRTARRSADAPGAQTRTRASLTRATPAAHARRCRWLPRLSPALCVTIAPPWPMSAIRAAISSGAASRTSSRAITPSRTNRSG